MWRGRKREGENQKARKHPLGIHRGIHRGARRWTGTEIGTEGGERLAAGSDDTPRNGRWVNLFDACG